MPEPHLATRVEDPARGGRRSQRTDKLPNLSRNNWDPSLLLAHGWAISISCFLPPSNKSIVGQAPVKFWTEGHPVASQGRRQFNVALATILPWCPSDALPVRHCSHYVWIPVQLPLPSAVHFGALRIGNRLTVTVLVCQMVLTTQRGHYTNKGELHFWTSAWLSGQAGDAGYSWRSNGHVQHGSVCLGQVGGSHGLPRLAGGLACAAPNCHLVGHIV